MSEVGDVQRLVVIDNGSSEIRVGYACEATPRFTIPAIVGRPRTDFDSHN